MGCRRNSLSMSWYGSLLLYEVERMLCRRGMKALFEGWCWRYALCAYEI